MDRAWVESGEKEGWGGDTVFDQILIKFTHQKILFGIFNSGLFTPFVNLLIFLGNSNSSSIARDFIIRSI